MVSEKTMKKHPLLAGAFPGLKKREVEKRVPTTQIMRFCCDLDALILAPGFERSVSCLQTKHDQIVKTSRRRDALQVDNGAGALLQ